MKNIIAKLLSVSIIQIGCLNEIPKELEDLSEPSKIIYQNLEETSLDIISDLPPHKTKKYLTVKKKHQKQYKMLEEKSVKLRKEEPFAALDCAMHFFQDCSNIFNEQGISKVHLEEHDYTKWPQRIYEIRSRNDECWPRRGIKNPIYNKPNKKDNWENQDDKLFSQLVKLLTTKPEDIEFNTFPVSKRDPLTWQEYITNYKNLACEFQNALTSYYDNLSENTKLKLYNESKEDFIETFSAIMVRNYRLSCHYNNDLRFKILTQLDEKLPLSNAILKVMPFWYFDDEMFNCTKIFLKVSGKKDEFKITRTFTNHKHQPVSIPQFYGCRTFVEPSNEMENVRS